MTRSVSGGCGAQTDSTTFVAQANQLVSLITEKTARAAALEAPTDDADFENLSLNLLPPGAGHAPTA